MTDTASLGCVSTPHADRGSPSSVTCRDSHTFSRGKIQPSELAWLQNGSQTFTAPQFLLPAPEFPHHRESSCIFSLTAQEPPPPPDQTLLRIFPTVPSPKPLALTENSCSASLAKFPKQQESPYSSVLQEISHLRTFPFNLPRNHKKETRFLTGEGKSACSQGMGTLEELQGQHSGFKVC